MSDRAIKILGLAAVLVALVIGVWMRRSAGEVEAPAPEQAGERAARLLAPGEARTTEHEPPSIAGVVLAGDSTARRSSAPLGARRDHRRRRRVPAAAAGLREGDVITGFDGHSVAGRRAAHVWTYMRVAAPARD